jgi:para-nitrobenzyl esterase
MLTLLKRWLDAPLWADHSSTSKPSEISRATTNLGLGLAFAAGALCASLQGATAAPGPLVGTQEGIVQGIIANGVAEFLGVPYAEPPVGTLRWKPAKKHSAWSGVLKTQAYAPICAQVTTLGVLAGPANHHQKSL